MRILVVDDSPMMRRVVCNALQAIGHVETEEAGDGEDALEKLNANAPDLVITDWNMPKKNGLELTKAIRAHPRFSDLPILMITTRGLAEDVIEAMRARVSSFVVKPFTPEVLDEKIRAVLKTA